MPEAMAPVDAAIQLARQLLEREPIAADPNAKLLVADLELQLVEVKMQLHELNQENKTLRDDLRRAEQPIMELRGDVYFDASGDGPFCVTCFDKIESVVKLAQMPVVG